MPETRPDRTLGANHDTFWEWCGKGELRLQRCGQCHHLAWPVVQRCENCGDRSFSWDRMSGLGKIVSWCSFERDYYKGAIPVPYDNILVELAEGPLFLSNPHGFDWREMALDLPVKLTFIDARDAAGPFMLPCFERD